MKTFMIEIVTPERVVISTECEIVVATGVEGQFAALPGHVPFLTYLTTASLMYRFNGQEQLVAVSGGVVEVLPDKVNILADEAELAEEIDLDRALQAKIEAEKLLKEAKSKAHPDDINQLKLELSLRKAVNRINVADSKHLKIRR